MSDINTIEPGDLIRDAHDNSTDIAVVDGLEAPDFTLIAKGPGWKRHDGSSVNPVPGAVVEKYGEVSRAVGTTEADTLNWPRVLFYRVTTPAPSQPPAPQPGWVATVELRFYEDQCGMVGITFPSGWTYYVDRRTVDKLDWQPPPPPPWEPEVGELVYWPGTGAVIVHAIKGKWAWVEGDNGPQTAPLSKLSPPKGGA